MTGAVDSKHSRSQEEMFSSDSLARWVIFRVELIPQELREEWFEITQFSGHRENFSVNIVDLRV